MPEGIQLLHLPYSALACSRTGISGSAPFHSFRKSPYADLARVRSPEIEYARANCGNASPPIGSLTTIPRCSTIF
jgi:hypothetical protein